MDGVAWWRFKFFIFTPVVEGVVSLTLFVKVKEICAVTALQAPCTAVYGQSRESADLLTPPVSFNHGPCVVNGKYNNCNFEKLANQNLI